MKDPIRLLTALVLVSAPLAHGQLASLQIDAASPPGAQSGTTLEVSVAGQDLDELSALTFTHPGIAAKHIGGSRFEVTVAEDVPADFYEVRAVGRFGLSNARPFEISALPQLSEAGDNQSADSAMPLPFDTYVNGTGNGEAPDYYRFSLKERQRIFVECVADRLDSRMDATLVLSDAAGTELMRDRDSYGRDPFIDFIAPADGDYVLAVYDFQFKGSGNHFYRLVVNTRAHVDYVMPPSGTPGKRERFTVYGRNLPGGRLVPGIEIDGNTLEQMDVEIDVPVEPDRLLSRAIAAVSATGTVIRVAGSHRAGRLALAEAPVVPEREPNDSHANAQYVSVPCEIGAQFYPAGDTEWFEFDARKDQVYWVEVYSERLGGSTDPFLVVQKVSRNTEGQEVARTVVEGDDIDYKAGGHIFPMKSRDAVVTFKADSNARYRVLVRDQFADADPRHTYRLVIREPRPDFAIVVGPRQFTDEGDQLSRATVFLRRDGSTRLNAMVQRRDGFNGPIEITVDNLPGGVIAQPCSIPAGKNEATLTFTAAADAPDFAGAVKVRGEAEIEGRKVVRDASGAGLLWGVGNWKQEFTRARLSPQVTLAVSGVEPAPVVVEPVEDKVYEASLAGKLEIPLQLAKRDGIKDKATIRPTGLPGLAKPKNTQIDNKAVDAKLVFEFTKKDGNKFQPGDYTIYAQTNGIMHYRANLEAQERAVAAKKKKDEVVARIESEYKSVEEQSKVLSEEVAKLNEQISAEALTADEGARLMGEKQAALAQATAARDAKAKELETAKQEQTAADAKLKQASDRAKPQERRFNTVSRPIRIRIVPAPVKVPELPQQAVKPETQVELPVRVERLFGFNEAVEVTVNVPESAKGIRAQPASIPKDASETKLVIAAAKDAAPGDKELRVDAKVKLNGEELVVSRTVKIRVEG